MSLPATPTSSAHPATSRTALVIGATGGIGSETAAALVRHGWAVRGLSRRPQPDGAGIDWVIGDAMNADDVRRAAEGASLIVHAANPPGYRDWDKLVLPMIDNTIAAAAAVGARIVLPGTIYNFGPDAFPSLHETSPQHPLTRKGAIRVALEQRLAGAAQAGTPVLIVRAGDYFGPRATDNSVFSSAMIRRGAPVRRILEVTARGTSHAWAYLPDVAETIARLMDRDSELADFAVFHYAGYQLAAGDMAGAITRAVGAPRPGVWSFPWMLVVALQPFVRMFRELAEMRYLWRTSIALDDRKLRAFLGTAMPLTPLDEAVRTSLKGLGCLPAR